MTNAIEQAKREMYVKFLSTPSCRARGEFESSLESYLELLRQDHEALHETARKRFEDIRELEKVSAEQRDKYVRLAERHARMTEERDAIQLRLHAVDHAYKTQQDRTATPTQDSGDRASCDATEANAEVIRAAARNVQLVITDWGMGDLKAKKAMRQIARIVNGDGMVGAACGALETKACDHRFYPCPMTRDDKSKICIDCGEEEPSCMHSFFAIGDDQMKCTFCGVGK